MGIQKFIDGVKLRELRDGVTQYAVICRETGELIGDCGIMTQQVDDQTEFEKSYKLLRKVWGRGYATEAAMACRDYGIKEKGIHRLISIIDPTNVPSVKVAQRVGMELEKKSRHRDSIVNVYSLLATGH